MLFGFFGQAKVIAVFVVASESNTDLAEFHGTMDQLNRFLKEQPLSVINRSTRQVRACVSIWRPLGHATFPASLRACSSLTQTIPDRHPPTQRLREYMHQSRHVQIAQTNSKLVRMLSPALQAELAWKTNKEWVLRVHFLRDVEREFLVMVALALTPTVYAPVRAPRGPPATRAPATRRSSPRPARAPSAERACRCSQRTCAC